MKDRLNPCNTNFKKNCLGQNESLPPLANNNGQISL